MEKGNGVEKDLSLEFLADKNTTQTLGTMFVNIVSASILLFLTLPIFIVVPIIIKLQSRGPVFYAGKRLGQHKKSFVMYKFRTLVVNAEEQIGSQLVSTMSESLEIPFGHFLRETRVDELPQLINVLKGDMNIIGPRPERQAVYEEHCRKIPGYDKRFQVKPGLLGYSQLFTPHNSPKKVRSLIDNAYLRRENKASAEITFLLYSYTSLGFILLKKIFKLFLKVSCRFILRRGHKEQRRYPRNKQSNTNIKLWYPASQAGDVKTSPDISGGVINISDNAMLIKVTEKIKESRFLLKIVTNKKRFFERRNRYKCVQCKGFIKKELISQKDSKKELKYVVFLEGLSPLNNLKLHNHFLDNSIL